MSITLGIALTLLRVALFVGLVLAVGYASL